MLDIGQFLADWPPGDAVSCGNRKDLPKKQRRHDWRSMGADICYGGDGFRGLAMVEACIRCGAGHQSLIRELQEGKP